VASSRVWWACTLAGSVLAVGVGFAVNRIAGSLTAVAGWFAVAVVAQVLGNVTAARQARVAASRATDPPVPPPLAVKDWWVDRDEVARAVKAVLARPRRGQTAGSTVGLLGTGGFGKSTVAITVGADREVRKRFGNRVYIVTIRRDARSRAQIAAIVAEQTRFITGDTQVFDDPDKAGQHLGRLLEQRPRTLLVIDDVWDVEQLQPFLLGAPNCVRLVTTRVPEVLPSGAERIPVDRMSAKAARQVLTWKLPLPESVISELIEVTGRWPLLVRLANRTITAMASTGADAPSEAVRLLDRLRKDGPEAVNLSGLPVDPDDSVHRNMLVHASVEAAVGLLGGDGRTRFKELGVFAEDEAVPISTVACLWHATGGLAEEETRDICLELAGLSLVTLDPAEGGRVTLHDVIRDYLRAQLGANGIERVNRLLMEQVASRLPAAGPLAGAGTGPGQAWWDVDGYMLDHAIEHLLDAGWADRAEGVAADLRWVQARLRQRGPAAPWSDLSRIATPGAAERARELQQIAHLLTSIDPPQALDAILHSRLEHLPSWGAQIAAFREGQPGLPRLVNDWPLPDLPDQMLRHALAGHTDWVWALAISPDGTWLASGDSGAVRIWDRVTGRNTATLTGHTGSVCALAISPDGTWLATAGGGFDDTVRIWDLATGKSTAVLKTPAGVTSVAISPDGTWLATAGRDGTVRIWGRATGKNTAILAGHTDSVRAVAISPNGSWLASEGEDEALRVWDLATGSNTLTMKGHVGWEHALAISLDGTWLASAGGDKTVRIWDRATGTNIMTLAGHTNSVRAVAISPDGTWLATAGTDATVRIWDRATGKNTLTVARQLGVSALAISPDGTWLASGGHDQVVRIWDMATSRSAATFMTEGSHAAGAVTISTDGTWLATTEQEGIVRIWDRATSENAAVLAGHSAGVSAVAISADGTWLATACGDDKTVRIWDRATSSNSMTLAGHTGSVRAVAISPDGTWLATAGSNKDETVRIGNRAIGRMTIELTTVRIWDRATGSNIMTLNGHIGYVSTVAISPDGTWLATAGWERLVRIWDRATGSNIMTLNGHTNSVHAVAISPDGTWLATAGSDDTVRIWDRGTGENTGVLKGHTDDVYAVAISPDGMWLASAGNDKTVRIWQVSILPRPVTVTAMRVDGSLAGCAWAPDSRGLAVCGGHGPYLFRFHPAT
jgi:WD40 repeat protein